jgi:hypothetical protein
VREATVHGVVDDRGLEGLGVVHAVLVADVETVLGVGEIQLLLLILIVLHFQLIN